MSSVLSTHVGWLATTLQPSAPGGVMPLSVLQRQLNTHVPTHTETEMCTHNLSISLCGLRLKNLWCPVWKRVAWAEMCKLWRVGDRGDGRAKVPAGSWIYSLPFPPSLICLMTNPRMQ